MRFVVRPRSAFAVLLLLTSLPLAAATITVTNTNDSGPGSFRQALLDATNGTRIEFAIGTGPQKIQPLTVLPQQYGVIIDGRTQPEYSGNPIIEIDGSLMANATYATGLVVSSGSEIYGLVVNNFIGTGVGIYYGGVIKNCYIGTDVSGTVAKKNGTGISAGGDSSRPTRVEANLISGNGTGLDVDSYVSVQGNVFGTNATQTAVIPGTNWHISSVGDSNSAIGGEMPNVFAGGGTGVVLYSSTKFNIFANHFGTTAAGAAMPLNTAISLYNSSENTIYANMIRNAEAAVLINGNSLRNNITGNSIDANKFGIDLMSSGYNGPTPNDSGDGDTGPNNLTNFPTLDKPVVQYTTSTITGTLSSVPNRAYRIELFASGGCNASGYGEGRDPIDSFDVTTDADGNVSFSRSVPAYPSGTAFTATATSALEGTSEFSPCAIVEGPGQFVFSTLTQSATEGSSKQVTVNRLHGAIGAASVNYAVTGGTATAADYSNGAGTLSFADGETKKSFQLQTTNDSTYEGNETIVLSLSGATNDATIGTPSSQTITINDDDSPPTVTFKSVQVKEGNSGQTIAEVSALLSQALDAPLTVPYTIASYSGATPGVDFIAGSGSITFAPGETEKTIPVTILGDTVWESVEYVYVSRTDTYGYAIVSILNDDPAPTVTVQDLTVVEGNAKKTVFVTLSAPTPVYGSVLATLISGSAQAGTDFVASSQYVSFYYEKTKTVPIEILGDGEPEPDERFEISLYSYTPSSIEAGPNGIVTIFNDDLGVGPAERWIAVGAKGTFTIALGQSVAQNESIALSSSVPSAVSVPPALLIPAGQSFIDFDATALAAGEDARITLTFPASLGGGTKSVRVLTYERAALRFSPARLSIPDGKTATVSVSLDPPSTKAVTIGLRPSERVSVGESLTIPPGGSASFVVTAKKIGAFTIDAQLPAVNGNEVQSLAGDVIAPPTNPTILSITPSHGPTSGGTEVTIRGEHLRAGCIFAFGGALASSVKFVSVSEMTATTPAHAGGSVDVALLCGSDSFTFQNGFGYVSEAPRASLVNPSSGTSAGGTHVRVNGTNFDGSCWLFFDRSAATDVVVRDATSLTGVAPAHAAGAADVTVRCSAGTSTIPLAFTYRNQNDPAPLITEVVPSAAAPGELVTIRGLNFRTTDSATVDTTAATIVDPSPESHVIRVPELPAGRASVSVTDLLGPMTTSGPVFSVLEARPPRITAIAPLRVPPGGELELTGEGFRPGYTFEIDGQAATILFSEYTRAVVRVSGLAAPGLRTVHVKNRADTLAAIGPNVEIIGDGAIVTSADPRCATTDGGVYATLRGRGFASGATVAFDDAPSPDVIVINATTMRVQVPPGAAGDARITVTDGAGHTATLTNGFSYASTFDPRGCGSRGRAVRH